MKHFYFGLALVLTSACAANAGPFDGIAGKIKDVAGNQGKKQLLKTLAKELNEGAPIVSSAESAFPVSATLPGAPFRPGQQVQRVAWQMAASTDGSVSLAPGDYSIPVALYCMKHSASSPSAHLYRLAPLQGKRAAAITALNSHAAVSRLPRSSIQTLSWNLQAGRKYEELPQDQRAIIDTVIPDYKPALSRNQLESAIETYNKLAPPLGFPNFEQALTQGMLGDVGKQFLKIRQFQSVLANTTDYNSLVRTLVPPAPSSDKGGPDKTPWSRISPQVYGRMFTPGGVGSTGQLQLRVLGQSQSNRRAYGGNASRAVCADDADNRVSVPLTSLVGDPQNEGIQPLSMIPEALPNRERDITCPSEALMAGKTPEEQANLRRLYHQVLGVQERLRARRQNFMDTLNPDDVFPTFYYNTTSNALDLINEGTLLHPDAALSEIVAFYTAYEYNANPNTREEHWKTYYDDAKGMGQVQSWDALWLIHDGAEAHIKYDLPRALDEVLSKPPYNGYSNSELKSDFDQFDSLFSQTSEQSFQDVSDALQKSRLGPGTATDILPKQRDNVAGFFARRDRQDAWSKAQARDFRTGDRPQPKADSDDLEKQGKRLCP